MVCLADMHGASVLAVAITQMLACGGAARPPTSTDVAAQLATLEPQSTLRITTRGRKTGRPHTKPVWFAVDGGSIWLGTLDARRDWVRNAQHDPAVAIEADGVRLRGRLTTITDAATDTRVHAMLRQKYWVARIGSWFGAGPERTFRVDGLESVAP